MISAKELRIGNLVKDENGNIWRIGCITNMYKDDSSLILERRIDNWMIKWYDNGVIKWYDNKCNVYPIGLMIGCWIRWDLMIVMNMTAVIKKR